MLCVSSCFLSPTNSSRSLSVSLSLVHTFSTQFSSFRPDSVTLGYRHNCIIMKMWLYVVTFRKRNRNEIALYSQNCVALKYMGHRAWATQCTERERAQYTQSMCMHNEAYTISIYFYITMENVGQTEMQHVCIPKSAKRIRLKWKVANWFNAHGLVFGLGLIIMMWWISDF